MTAPRRFVNAVMMVAAGTLCWTLTACATQTPVKPSPPPTTAKNDIPVRVCPPGVRAGMPEGVDFAILGKLRDGTQDASLEICVPANAQGKPKSIPCHNGTPPSGSSLPDCTKAGGHDPKTNPLKFKRMVNVPLLELEGSTCIMLCSPPGLLLEGTSSCQLLCL